MQIFLTAITWLSVGILVGALGALGYFTYTGSTLKWKK